MSTSVNVADKTLKACGLVNLGNTCYLNATLQCLHTVTELRRALTEYSLQHATDTELEHELTVALHGVFSEMDTAAEAVEPTKFWNVLRSISPEFRRTTNGTFLQQDAEECWSLIVNNLSQTLKSEITQLFGIELGSRLHCPRTGEASSYEVDYSFMLKCHITEKVNDLLEGLWLGFQTELEKMSASLGLSELHQKVSEIIKLPQYLSIQFLRYFWNPECNQTQKIDKRVDFPIVLDVTGLCCDELKASLESGGHGLYDLVAILTHEGESTHCGHYVAWIKEDHAAACTSWVEMDDRKANVKKEADLAALSGGGSGQMAYLCIYKARYESQVKVKRPEKRQPSYVADSDDDIIPLVVQKVKDAILEDEDFIRQVHTHYNLPNKNYYYPQTNNYYCPQTNNYYFQTNNCFMSPRESTSTSDVLAFLGFFILGVMAFLAILVAVIPQGFIGSHMTVFSIVILALGIGFGSGIALALIYCTSVGPRPKAPLWVINMLSMVCGFATYSSLALWSIDVLVNPLLGRMVCWIVFLGAPLIWMLCWFCTRKEKEHKKRGDESAWFELDR